MMKHTGHLSSPCLTPDGPPSRPRPISIGPNPTRARPPLPRPPSRNRHLAEAVREGPPGTEQPPPDSLRPAKSDRGGLVRTFLASPGSARAFVAAVALVTAG